MNFCNREREEGTVCEGWCRIYRVVYISDFSTFSRLSSLVQVRLGKIVGAKPLTNIKVLSFSKLVLHQLYFCLLLTFVNITNNPGSSVTNLHRRRKILIENFKNIRILVILIFFFELKLFSFVYL